MWPLKCLKNVLRFPAVSFRLIWDYQKYKVAFHRDCCFKKHCDWTERTPSLGWSLPTGFSQTVNERANVYACSVHLNPSSADLYTDALHHYTVGIQHGSSLQTSFITGALRTLRSFGHRERMHQFMLRYIAAARAARLSNSNNFYCHNFRFLSVHTDGMSWSEWISTRPSHSCTWKIGAWRVRYWRRLSSTSTQLCIERTVAKAI